MGRSPCCEKEHTNKGAWTKEEDQRLMDYIRVHGEGCWRSLPKAAGLLRCGKSCRLRWINYLRPDLKRGNFTDEEDEIIIKLHSLLGNKWSLIAGRLPGRTDNEIKNYWNTHIKRKLISRGIDPHTHRPLNERTTTATIKTTTSATTKATQLDFKNTPPQSLAEISLLKSQLDFKYNNNFHSSQYSSFNPKKTETTSVEENNCTSSSMTTDEEQQQQQQQQKRESHQDQDVNLDLTIGLALTQTSSANSAESRLQQPVSSCQLFGSVLTRPVCLCWQLDGERRELCRNCQNQNQNQNQSSKSNHSK